MLTILRKPLVTAVGVLLMVALTAVPAAAQFDEQHAPGTAAFERTWARTDKPVADGQVQRTWMWGPAAFTAVLTEEYADSPGGERQVQYFDKARMEINQPAAPQDALWYVTNGLLVVELVSGNMQVGDAAFIDREPAEVQIAGDPGQAFGPTYADIQHLGLLSAPATPEGELIDQELGGDDQIAPNRAFAEYGVTAAERVQVPGIDHTVASVFWEFMTSTGLVYENGQFVQDQLFENPFYATGYPITEAYWSVVPVDGVAHDVLWQCFERRCLTYTPDNPTGFQVEAGNVGQHYYTWRYLQNGDTEDATIYLVQIGDDGQNGIPIGCDDSLVGQTVQIPANLDTAGKVDATLSELFTYDPGEGGLYNALLQSNLQVDSVTVAEGVATVEISGDVAVGGVCDEPRFIEQIRQTVLDVPGVDDATITVNGTALDDLFGQQGGAETQIFLIALEDDGQSGPVVGCGDSLIEVTVQIEPSDDLATRIQRTLEALFAIEDEFYGESGLYNALHQSDVTVDSVTVEEGVATVELSGDLISGGTCDDPRIVGQITETVLSFEGVDSASITINGTPLDEHFDQSGQ